MSIFSSGSSGRVRGGAEKHKIYAAAFGGHLFYDLFSQGQGGPSPPPLDPLLIFSVSEAISWNLDYHVLSEARHQCGLVSNLFTRTNCRTVNRNVCDGVNRVH